MSMFNTLFTSLPVIFLGVFERDLRASTLLAVPELYTLGQRNECFNFRKYFWWMFMATCEVSQLLIDLPLLVTSKLTYFIGNAFVLSNVLTSIPLPTA
jgi:magnesium-transporting ATPase (P-type)